MKSKIKRTGASNGKKAQGKELPWSDKKKNIRIRKKALKKIFDHFNDPVKENHKPQNKNL
ncbi:MAG: hypothetical protein R6T99_11385 [Bacteroidales bacterium]